MVYRLVFKEMQKRASKYVVKLISARCREVRQCCGHGKQDEKEARSGRLGHRFVVHPSGIPLDVVDFS